MYKQKIIQFAFVLGIICLLTWPLVAMGQVAAATADPLPIMTDVTVLASDTMGIEFVLNTADFVQLADGSLTVAGLDEVIKVAGAPALPYFATTLILPPEAEVLVSVTETDVASQNVTMLPAASQPTFEGVETVDDGISPYALLGEAGEVVGYAAPPAGTVADTAVYQNNAFYPTTAYELSEPAYLRDFRLVELRLYPLRYNPVTGELQQIQTMQVQVSFVGGTWADLRPSASYQNTFQQSLADTALNYEQGQHWRSLPRSVQNGLPTQLPIGTDVYKIEIDQDGIYELTGADFAAAGMNIANVNPTTLQMLYRGQSMSYQLVGSNGDGDFDPAEKIRFYGWAFSGSRAEKQFVANNVLWVWADGTPSYMDERPNETGMGYPVDQNYLAEITREPENNFFVTWTEWDNLPNEPDAWFWDYIVKPFNTLTKTYTIDLFNPDPTGPNATYLMEFNARRRLTTQPHIVRSRINNNPNLSVIMWTEPPGYGRANINLTATVPTSDLNHGTNTLTTGYATTTTDQLYLNRITVEYMRQLVAVDNQLIFQDEVGGSREFNVSGYSVNNVNNVFVWDVTVPTETVAIQLSSGDIVPSGGFFTYKIGSDHPADARFIATTAGKVLTANDLAANISQYVPPSLEPPTGEAEWLAVSHHDFMTQALQLGAHRAHGDFGGFVTHTVDIADVFNQYGYGLPVPEALRSYLLYALGNWTVAPSYVTLFGDATQNPRNLPCLAGCSVWDANEVNFLLTDLVFVDRYQGLIPSDLPFVLLSGDDVLADMAIGRIVAKTQTEAASIVDKIIEFDTNQFDTTEYSWQDDVLFVADNYDPNAGNFCAANEATSLSLPASFDPVELCLPGVDGTNPPTPAQVAEVRQAMSETVNITGTTVLNYRGHGSIENWTGNGLLSTQMTNIWQNNGRPFMILSADCLDGNFAWPGRPGLGEVFLKLDDRGTVAHWASSGLGLTSEHSVLHQGFYDGVFAEGLTAVGDAANYAKRVYIAGGNHQSEAYSFNLQGDPAMQLFRPDVNLTKQPLQEQVDPGDPADFLLTVSNDGLYPARVVVTDTLPTELSFVTMTASLPTYAPVISGNQVHIEFISPFALGESATITLTTSTITDFIGVTTNWATAVNTGQDLNVSNNTASAIITSSVPSVTLSTFTAVALDNAVKLDWIISLEINIDAYKVMRSEEGGPFVWLQNLGNNGYIPSQGNVPADYQAIDDTAQNGRSYRYRLYAVQSNGSEVGLGIREVVLPPYASSLAFNATPLDNEVALDWQVTSEYELAAYSIERGQNGVFTWLQDLGTNGFIMATGDINTAAEYLVTDTTAVNGQTYTYRLHAHQELTPGARTAVIATRTVTLMDINLVAFTATALDSAVQLDWRTLSEINIGSYRIERGQNGSYIWLQDLGINGYISAVGGPSVTADYVVTDTTAINGETYDYHLIAVLNEPNVLEREVAEDSVFLNSTRRLYMPFVVRP